MCVLFLSTIQVWPIEGIKKFETLSYLPPLSQEALLKQIDFLIRSKWVPCLVGSLPGVQQGWLHLP